LRYLWMALFGAVPTELKIARTCSCSTSLRVCSTVFGGLKPIIQREQPDLAPVHAAPRIDHREIGELGPADSAGGGDAAAVRHGLAELDFCVGDARTVFLLCERGRGWYQQARAENHPPAPGGND